MSQKQNIVVICGPTASGKTSLALDVANRLPQANLLSVDSRQTYEGLDIVTGKDIPLDLPEKISVFGLNLFSPHEASNISAFEKYSHNIILSSLQQHTPLIIVGGTGFYLHAITHNLSDTLVPQDSELRQQIESLPTSELQSILSKLSPEKFASLNHSDLFNPRRLIRAIEVATFRGKHTITTYSIFDDIEKQSVFNWVGIMPSKEQINLAIRQRVVSRLQNGAIDEVIKLLSEVPNRALPVHTTLGVPEITRFLDGDITREELVDLWTKAEIDYARRQIVWFKKQKDIIWYDKDSIDEQLINRLVTLLKNE